MAKFTKFIGIITDNGEMYTEAVKILRCLFPKHQVIKDGPIRIESEADHINLQDGIVIRIMPDYRMQDYEHVDANIEALHYQDLYNQLEKLQMQLI